MKIFFIEALCPPALLYLLYTTVHVALDLSLGLYATSLIKVVMGLAGVVILDALCSVDLGVVSWAIVVTPFIMVALASSISLGLGLDRMLAKSMKEGFTTMNLLTGDNLKNRDLIVSPLKNQDALPLSSSSIY
jgi:hypothetical protein